MRLHEDEDKDFKHDDNQGESKRISFLDCLKKSDGSYDNYCALKVLKTQAINQEKSFSQSVINLIVLMSEDDQGMAKFQVIGDALKWVSQGENLVVIKRIVDLLHTLDVKLSKKGSKK